MRFKDIKKFKVDELSLDQGNYRFIAAENQQGCIEKIFAASPQNFRNLLKSVAEDDLGELLLVYQNKGKSIVLDGNRRLACLKVLYDPGKYAPTEAIKEFAENLVKLNKVDFAGIQAQVSDDKQLIFKTVYERHAAGAGKSRIGWSAYGAARFRFDQKTEETDDWYSMALLLETEQNHPEWSAYIDGDYSHEVFRRIFKAALEKGIISRAIFSDKDQRVKKSVDKKLLKDAVEKAHRFLTSMKNKDLGLSRSGTYADKSSVDIYLNAFSPSPDNVRVEASKPAAANNGTAAGSSTKPASSSSAGSNAGGNTASNGGSSSTGASQGASTSQGAGAASGAGTERQQGNGIEKSEAVLKKLTELKSDKLIGLYNSLCTVSTRAHPQLMYVGAWSFFESLSALMGKTEGTSFESYLNSQMNAWGYARQIKKDYAATLADIDKKGNANKHSPTYHSTGADQLRADFKVLEPFIITILDKLIADKNNKAA